MEEVVNTSDRFIKEALTIMKKGIDGTFPSHNDYISLIKG